MRQEATVRLHPSLIREAEEVEIIATFTIPGEPASKARPRFNGQGIKSRTYTPAKTLQAEQMVAWLFRQARPGFATDDKRTFGLAASFHAGTWQRRDVDNMIKLLCDGLNGVAWKDDAQVSEVSGRRFLGSDEARTEVCIYVTGVVARPEGTCELCGNKFPMYKSWAEKKKFCSSACRTEAARVRKESICKNCGGVFLRTSGHAKTYCSSGCQDADTTISWNCVQCGEKVTMPKSWPRKNLICEKPVCVRAYWDARRAVGAKGVCTDCKGPTSKKSYPRCRACSAVHRSRGKVDA